MWDKMRRKPAVAGYYYPRGKKELFDSIKSMVDPNQEKEDALCIVSPHAGISYSGPVAGAVFSSVRLPGTFVILGPSHGGINSRAALMKEGVWGTPLGDVPLEPHLAGLIESSSSVIDENSSAHAGEHSLEIQLPFIQYFKKMFSIVPICISSYITYKELEDLGKAVSSAIKKFSGEVMIVASTDMSHYVSQDEAKKKDYLAIKKVLELDPKGLYETVMEEKISMCGFQPTVAAIIAAKELGAKKTALVKYQTSGDISGDYLQVVGYAGIRIS